MVVLPAPFGPSRPTTSPRADRQRHVLRPPCARRRSSAGRCASSRLRAAAAAGRPRSLAASPSDGAVPQRGAGSRRRGAARRRRGGGGAAFARRQHGAHAAARVGRRSPAAPPATLKTSVRAVVGDQVAGDLVGDRRAAQAPHRRVLTNRTHVGAAVVLDALGLALDALVDAVALLAEGGRLAAARRSRRPCW